MVMSQPLRKRTHWPAALSSSGLLRYSDSVMAHGVELVLRAVWFRTAEVLKALREWASPLTMHVKPGPLIHTNRGMHHSSCMHGADEVQELRKGANFKALTKVRPYSTSAKSLSRVSVLPTSQNPWRPEMNLNLSFPPSKSSIYISRCLPRGSALSNSLGPKNHRASWTRWELSYFFSACFLRSAVCRERRELRFSNGFFKHACEVPFSPENHASRIMG